jgi:hypothetical protein
VATLSFKFQSSTLKGGNFNEAVNFGVTRGFKSKIKPQQSTIVNQTA